MAGNSTDFLIDVWKETVTNMSGNVTEESVHSLNERFSRAIFPFVIILATLSVIGVIGNLIVLIIFATSTEYKSNVFRMFVLCLALVDLLSCAIVIPAEAATEMQFFDFENELLCQVKGFFNLFCAISSCFILLVISINRYRSVCQPFKTPFSPKLIKLTLFITAFVIPLMVATPGAYITGIAVYNKPNRYGGITKVKACIAADRFRDSNFRKVYKLSLGLIIITFSCIYVVLYTFVMKAAILHLRAIESQRRSSDQNGEKTTSVRTPSNGADRELGRSLLTNFCSVLSEKLSRFSRRSSRVRSVKKIPYKTLVWLTIIVIFILTYSANFVQIFRADNALTLSEMDFVIFTCFAKMYFINHIVNPLVYFIFVEKFRHECKVFIECKILKRKTSSPPSNSNSQQFL